MTARRAFHLAAVGCGLVVCQCSAPSASPAGQGTDGGTTTSDAGSVTSASGLDSSTSNLDASSEAFETGDGSSDDTGAGPPDPDPLYGEFAWPVDGWVSAIDTYWSGSSHSGSADIGAPYETPVGAARSGTVIASTWTTIGGYLVRIQHEGGYRTTYSHFSDPPLVEVGDEVVTNQIIGYLGRTGNAGHPHVHFAIWLDDERQVISGLDFGAWVERGRPLPGPWPGLDTLELPHTTSDVRVTVPALPVFAGPAHSEAVVGELLADQVVSVRGSHRGYYRIWHEAQDAWIVHTGTLPVRSHLFGVRVVSNAAPVRADPDDDAEVVGSVELDQLITVFGQSDGYYKFLYGHPTSYAWLAVDHTEPAHEFGARIWASSANVRAGPGVEYDVVGSLSFFDIFEVDEQERGWYRLEYDGQTAWVAGWLSQGRRR